MELTDGAAAIAEVSGRDAALVPREVSKNVAAIAAQAYLRAAGSTQNAIVSIEKGLALAGGMGGSAASRWLAFISAVVRGMGSDRRRLAR